MTHRRGHVAPEVDDERAVIVPIGEHPSEDDCDDRRPRTTLG
jgi:hypothetical protein